MRSPDATARTACPIHIPSMRSGMTSIARRRLKATKLPGDSDPDTTMRPATRSTAAWATIGMKVSRGT